MRNVGEKGDRVRDSEGGKIRWINTYAGEFLDTVAWSWASMFRSFLTFYGFAIFFIIIIFVLFPFYATFYIYFFVLTYEQKKMEKN